MDSIRNTLQFLYENWINILVCVGLIAGIAQKTRDYLSKSKDERVNIAKAQIKVTMLNIITKAEIDYETWNQSGSIKRSQVIKSIFDDYPVLSKVADQEEIVAWIDTEINNSLKTLRDIVKVNANKEN